MGLTLEETRRFRRILLYGAATFDHFGKLPMRASKMSRRTAGGLETLSAAYENALESTAGV